MLTPITIQLVCPSDIEELLTLSRKTFYEAFAHHFNDTADFEAYTSIAFTEAKLLSEVNNPNSVFYFALINDVKVGYIKLNYSIAQTELRDENALEVERIYVLASQQGKQIGGQLIDFALTKAIDTQLQYVWLGVWEHNHNAIRFYERKGFEAFSTHKFVIGNDIQTDIMMKKKLV